MIKILTILSMQSIKKIICSILFLAFTLQSQAIQVTDSLRYEVLMNTAFLKTINFSADFIGEIDVTPERHVLLSTKTQAFLLGWGGIKPLGKQDPGVIGSFAFTPDSLLMVIKNSEICYFDSLGLLTSLYKLPYSDMGISAGRKVMYVYDRKPGQDRNGVYEISPGGKYRVLFELSSQIKSVVEYNNLILFASGNMLCQFDPATKEYEVLAALSKEKIILSVTTDHSGDRIYFSTDKEIYAINKTSAILISENLGGVLKFYSDGLMVFDPGKKFLIRIVGIEDELKKAQIANSAGKTASESDLLTNSSIVDLVRAELADPLIVALIRRSKVNFNLGVDAIIELSGQGVSSDVILEMKQAMGRQSSQIQQK